MWQFNLKVMPELGSQSKLVMPERDNRFQTHYNHNHKYIIKIIHLHHDFMTIIIQLFHLQQVWSILQYSYIYEYHSEARTKKHHTIIESILSPTSKQAWNPTRLDPFLSRFVMLVLVYNNHNDMEFNKPLLITWIINITTNPRSTYDLN